MEVSTILDWFQGTGTHDMRPKLPWKFHACNGWGNYPQAWSTDFGLKIGTNVESPRQGWHLIARGDEMQEIRHQGIDSLKWLNIIMPHLRKVSRMDVACDIQSEVEWELFDEDIQGYESRLKLDSEVIGRARAGHTVYFGSPKSKVRIRIYDKAAELKLLSLAIVRVELQARDKQATQLAKDMRYLADVSAVGRKAIADRLTVKAEWWKGITDGIENAEITPISRNEADYWKYLQQVLKSLEKRLYTGQNLDEIDAFKHHFDGMIERSALYREIYCTSDSGTSDKDSK